MKLSGSIVIYDYGEETYPYKKPMHEFIGANTAFRKEVFEECGLFRNDLGVGAGLMGEDVEIIDRLYKNKKHCITAGKPLSGIRLISGGWIYGMWRSGMSGLAVFARDRKKTKGKFRLLGWGFPGIFSAVL